MLTAASIIVSRDTRYSLDGNNLVISNVAPQDAGDYICQISDHVNRDLIHTVEILRKYCCNHSFIPSFIHLVV